MKTKLLKRVSTLLLALALIVTLLPIGAFAAPSYTISVSSWKTFKDRVNRNSSWNGGPSGSYKLTADITIPAGESVTTTFTGTFDGNGHTITTSGTIFNTVGAGATIKNFTVEMPGDSSSSISSTPVAYSINASNTNTITFQNITNNANVTIPSGSTAYGAGIVGRVSSNATVVFENCVNNGHITSANQTGGIVANAPDTSTYSASLSFKNCVNNGNVTTSNLFAGGILGHSEGKADVSFSYCTNKGDIQSSGNAGGIFGNFRYGGSTTFDYCINMGNITQSGSSTNATYGAAGILGCVRDEESSSTNTFTHCINTGALSASTDRTGSLCLNANSSKLSYSDCYYVSATDEFISGASPILVGNADFAAEHGIELTLAALDFAIVCKDSQIYIIYGSSAALTSAVLYFDANYINGSTNKITIEEGTVDIVRSEYEYSGIQINGVYLCDYVIVYPSDCDLITYYAGFALADDLRQSSGIDLKVVPDTTAKTDYEILIGVTNRQESIDASKISLQDDEYILCIDGTKIVMQGKDYMVAGGASALIHSYIDVDTDGNIINLPTSPVPKTFRFQRPTSAILMIGDGMGQNHIDMAKNNGLEAFVAESLQSFSWCTTYSTSVSLGKASYTDSAASGTALATGYKTLNNYVGVDENGNILTNVREMAYASGAKTAILTTDVITGATPASFLCHNESRSATSALQSEIDALIDANMVDYCLGTNDADDLTERTRDALAAVSGNNSTFFAMIEGAYIDKYSHSNATSDVIHCVERFNDSIAYTIAFTVLHPETVLVITADHECGGLTSGFEFTSLNHTNTNVPVFALGNTDSLITSETIDNTDIGSFIGQIFTKTESEGLEYTLNDEGTGYIVSGAENCTDEKVIIPAIHKGLPVVSIGSGVFENNTNITAVYVPASITSIETSAFAGATALEAIYYPASTELWDRVSKASGWDSGSGNYTVYCFDGDALALAFFTFASGADISGVEYDKTNRCLRLDRLLTADDLKKIFEDSALTFATATGDDASGAALGTGYTVTSEIDSKTQTLTLIVLGDIAGDGVIDSADSLAMSQSMTSGKPLDGVYAEAADYNGDGLHTSVDLLMIKLQVKGE